MDMEVMASLSLVFLTYKLRIVILFYRVINWYEMIYKARYIIGPQKMLVLLLRKKIE